MRLPVQDCISAACTRLLDASRSFVDENRLPETRLKAQSATCVSRCMKRAHAEEITIEAS